MLRRVCCLMWIRKATQLTVYHRRCQCTKYRLQHRMSLNKLRKFQGCQLVNSRKIVKRQVILQYYATSHLLIVLFISKCLMARLRLQNRYDIRDHIFPSRYKTMSVTSFIYWYKQVTWACYIFGLLYLL